MRLTAHSDYALRLLMQLASNPDRLCTIAEVSNSYGISKNHLMKVANLLTRAGIVESIRGRAGGLKLARDANCISVAEVVRLTEGDMAVLDCLQQQRNSDCHVAPVCRLKGALAEATEAFMAVLEDYSIADTVADNRELQELLILAKPI